MKDCKSRLEKIQGIQEGTFFMSKEVIIKIGIAGYIDEDNLTLIFKEHVQYNKYIKCFTKQIHVQMYIEFITFFIVWYLIGCIIYNMKKKYFQRPTHLECISSCIFSKRSFIEISIYGNLFIILHASAIMIDFLDHCDFFSIRFYLILYLSREFIYRANAVKVFLWVPNDYVIFYLN